MNGGVNAIAKVIDMKSNIQAKHTKIFSMKLPLNPFLTKNK